MERLRLFLLLCGICLCVNLKAVTDSRSEKLQLILAVERIQSGQLDTARMILEKLSSDNPANDAAHYYLGYVAVSLNDAATALRSFETAYNLDSTNIWYARRLAAIYFAVQRIDDAERLYAGILAKRPGDMDAIGNMADIHIKRGRLHEADSLLNVLETVEGPNGFTVIRRLEILRGEGRHEEFFAGLQSLFSNPDLTGESKVGFLEGLMKSSDPRYNALHLKQYDTLVALCISLHPADTNVDAFAAGYYYTTQRYDESLKICAKHPDDPRYMFTELSCQWAKEDDAAALEVCDRILAMPSTEKAVRVSLLINKGDILQRMGETSRSVQQYRRALKLDPDNATALNNYAYFLACRGKQLSTCENMSRKALDAEPENVSFIDTYAWILYLRGKLSLSRDYFKKAMLYGGRDNAEVLGHYATVLEALGDSTLAEEYRKRAEAKGKTK